MNEPLSQATKTMLSWLPRSLRPVVAIVFVLALLIVAGILGYNYLFGKEIAEQCELFSLKGTLLNNASQSKLKNVRLELENASTTLHDVTKDDGTFLLEGVRLPVSKVISLLVTLADGKSIALTSIDLNNRTKYPITSECVVDLQTVRVDVSSNDKTSALPSVERRIPAQNKGKELLSTTPSKPTSVSSDAKIMRIAVLPFQFNSADEKYTWISKGVPDALTTELAGKISYQFIENLQRDKVLEEINFQQTKYVDEASAVRIGKLLGAQQVIVGSCQLLNNEMEINSRLIDVETGTIMKKAQVRGEIKNVFQLQKELADAWKKQIN